MSKLPKGLSLNGRAMSTSGAQASQSMQHRTNPRSGTSIIRSLMDNGPREPRTLEQQVNILLNRLRREQNRVKALKEGHRTPDKEQKIVLKEGHINRMIFNLQALNAKKQAADTRELKKFKNNPKGTDYVGQGEDFVKLEGGKVVPKVQTFLIEHRLKPLATKQPVHHIEQDMLKKARAEEAKKEKLRRMSILEVYEKQKLEGVHSEAAVKEIDETIEEFDEITEISEDDFEKMFGGDDE